MLETCYVGKQVGLTCSSQIACNFKQLRAMSRVGHRNYENGGIVCNCRILSNQFGEYLLHVNIIPISSSCAASYITCLLTVVQLESLAFCLFILWSLWRETQIGLVFNYNFLPVGNSCLNHYGFLAMCYTLVSCLSVKSEQLWSQGGDG